MMILLFRLQATKTKKCVATHTQLAGTLKSLMATCGGATRIQLRASAHGVVKVLIPLMMGTP